jgi:HAD superfamily hydrolase (TIGR01490 family)
LKRLVLFDLDGTLTSKDTFLEFLKYVRGSAGFYFGMLMISPYLVPYKLGLYPNWKAKERALNYFLAEMNYEELRRMGVDFSNKVFPQLLRPNALKKLEQHQTAGDDIYIVSASCEEWVAPWARQKNLEAICTRLEIEGGKITGRIHGKNNYGPEKARRVDEIIDIDTYDEIHVYGDSRGDKEMLAMATHPHYREF